MTKTSSFDRKALNEAQQRCLDVIESLGIYELRALARIFGDSSPTTLKRADHIKTIMDKIISGENLRPIPLRQGRPFKELSNIESILKELSSITGKDYLVKNALPVKKIESKEIVFHQEEESVLKQKLFAVDTRGILVERNEDEFYLVDQETSRLVLVKKSLDARLEEFDFVVGRAVIMNEKKDYILDKINYINYQPEKVYEPKKISKQAPIEFDFENKSYPLGTRYMFKTSKFLNDESATKSLIASLKSQKVASILLAPNVLAEDILSYENLGFANTIFVRYEDNIRDVENAIYLAQNHIERLQKLGLSSCLFVEDLTTFAVLLDASIGREANALGHNIETVEQIKSLYLLAKKDEYFNSSIITTFDELDLKDQMYLSLIYKISKYLN